MAVVNVFVILLCFISLARKANGDDEQDTNAFSYDANGFAAGLRKNRHFVMFYAPWCGHCKNLTPTWNELAKKYKLENSPVVIAKVDCTIHTELCAIQSVVGFPTLKLFDIGGDNPKRYSGKRDLLSLNKFVQDQIHGIESPDAHAEEHGTDALVDDKSEEVPESKSHAAVLTDESFAGHAGNGLIFIKFYAPWCGHCQKLAPIWENLADSFNLDNRVTIAKIDCTQHKVTCKQQDITGYPTLLWYKDGQKIEKYQGLRRHDSLKKYVLLKLSEGDGAGDEKQPETTTVSNPESKVQDLTESTFQSHLSSNELVLVKFYAPWCGHCKRLAPVWEELAKELLGQRVSIAKVDCTQYKSVCENNQVRGYPTLKLFRKGEFEKDYKGVRDMVHLHKFVKKQMERHDEL